MCLQPFQMLTLCTEGREHTIQKASPPNPFFSFETSGGHHPWILVTPYEHWGLHILVHGGVKRPHCVPSWYQYLKSSAKQGGNYTICVCMWNMEFQTKVMSLGHKKARAKLLVTRAHYFLSYKVKDGTQMSLRWKVHAPLSGGCYGHIKTSDLPGCVVLSWTVNFSESQFLLWPRNGKNASEWYGKDDVIMDVTFLARCLALDQCPVSRSYNY